MVDHYLDKNYQLGIAFRCYLEDFAKLIGHPVRKDESDSEINF